MMWWSNDYMVGFWWAVGAFVLLLTLVAVVAIALTSTREPRAPSVPHTGVGAPNIHTKSPRQILDERYAKGELTTEEYKERIETLGSDS